MKKFSPGISFAGDVPSKVKPTRSLCCSMACSCIFGLMKNFSTVPGRLGVGGGSSLMGMMAVPSSYSSNMPTKSRSAPAAAAAEKSFSYVRPPSRGVYCSVEPVGRCFRLAQEKPGWTCA